MITPFLFVIPIIYMRCAPECTRLVACCLQARNACTHYVLMCKFTALISKKQINSTYYALFVSHSGTNHTNLAIYHE